MVRGVRLLFGLFVLVLLPSSAYAQAAIAGVVRDASGGVLPGVTVEASSPALIEKVRTAVSDGTGQYRIEDLRPGTYTVRFTLTGLQHRVARRRRAHRLGNRHHQHRHARRRGRRDDHGDGRDAGRGRAGRAAPDGPDQRGHQRHPVGRQLQLAARAGAGRIRRPAGRGVRSRATRARSARTARCSRAAAPTPKRGCWWTASASPCRRPAAPTT